jgi:hypothetical protein
VAPRQLGRAGLRSTVIRLRSLFKRVPLLEAFYGQLRKRLGNGHLRTFTIALYEGPAPWTVAEARDAARPILTSHDVTDVPAAFVADPFVIRRDGAWFLFFEVMRADTLRGEVAVATSPDGRNWRYEAIVLAEPFHLSYPFVFEWQGATYMIPESREAGSVRLYRSNDFPFGWELISELLAGDNYADSTLFRHRGRWWMLTETGMEAGGRAGHDVLRLFHAADLLGPWIEHPASPIVESDPRIARPAGPVVTHGGRLLRFAQDCTSTYGHQVFALEIEELTLERYVERPVGTGPMLGPGRHRWNRGGMHHIDALIVDDAWMAFVDGWTIDLKKGVHGMAPRGQTSR